MATLENLLEVSDSTFEDEVLNSKLPVLVFFWTESCSGCKMMSPEFKDISKGYKRKNKKRNTNRMLFATYDLDSSEGGEVADHYFKKYNLHWPPVMMLFNSGKMVGYAGGYPRDGLLKTWIERIYRFL